MVVALRVVMGARTGAALGAIALSWVSFFLQGFLTLLLSPCLFWMAYHWARGDLGAALGSWGSRQSFKRHLQSATVNPQDAEAHYQLGLIHLQRQQVAEAAERFRKAVAIDAREVDAHFQLAKIAHAGGRLEEALGHLEQVLRQEPKHAQHEAWREAGAVYVAHGSYEQACAVLKTYVAARPYDPEGLYLLGLASRQVGDTATADEMLARCVEAARTAPDHRQRDVRPWMQKAEQELRRTTSVTP
jgi:tetratricopeptide (TPR) repeat protein